MRIYVITTGLIFALLTVLHVWRMFVESGLLTREPWYVLITLASALLSIWAWRLISRRHSTS
jgi:hypothetical protein